jgi:membrane dipeptidase
MRILTILLAAVLVLTGCADPETKLEKKAAKIHASVLTIDTHTDTPLRLGRAGFDFGIRNDPMESRSKIDLPRMKEGGMDAIWFAVFVGQGERTPEGNARARATAEEVTDKIYETVRLYPDDLEVAMRADDLKKIEGRGRKAICIGMENGYPLGTDLNLLNHFYDRGIRYVTLVHTGNNDICDSSNDSTEHNGLSDFGKEVVARMNELGMIIDLSHASDQTVEDVLSLSKAPVMASHSGAKAICDNPRNLNDDLLVKLRENGGVIQVVAYSGYIKTPEPNPQRDSARNAVREKHGDYNELDGAAREAFIKDWYAVDRVFPQELATVSEMVDHIDHIVEVIGIDYVGIGTDFDGGGGLEGCFDVSEMGNITLELVRRGYKARDIRKIWGGNFLRVFKEVEAAAI